MEILLAPEAAERLARLLTEARARRAQGGGEGDPGAQGAAPVPHARLRRDGRGAWRVEIAPAEPGDHVGLVGGLPFAVEGPSAADVERVLVGWRQGEFVVGEILAHGCSLDAEIRE